MRWLNLKLEFLAIVAVASAIGCTRPESSTSNVQIVAPTLTSGQKVIQSQASQKISSKITASGVDDDPFNSLINPTVVSDFNCYVVFVGGPGYDGGGTCTVSDGTSFTLGAFAGGIPSGQTVEMTVPSGAGRTIYLVGFHASSTSYCADFHSSMAKSQLSEPFVVAHTSVDLAPGDATVTLTPAMSMAKVSDCKFTSSSGAGGGGYNGSGADGDISTTGLVNLTSTMNQSGSRYLMSTSKVNQITNNSDGTAQITVVATGWNSASYTHIGVNDEVMLYITGGSPGTPGGCNQVFPGFAISGRVTSAGTGGNGNSFSMQIGDNRWLQIPAANLTASGTSPTTFCRVAAIRVPNLHSIIVPSSTLTISSGTITPLDFSNSDDMNLGAIPIRVNTNIFVAAGASLTLDASGRGYKGGGSVAVTGQSSMGKMSGSGSTMPNFGSGGGSSATGKCGGGHGGSGGCANPGGIGMVEGDVFGCGSANPDAMMACLSGKFFFGGGGGGGVSGGTGGGAIRLFVQDAVIDGSFSILAQGSNGTSSGDAGGAGGSIFANFRSLTGAGNFIFSAYGGNGVSGGGVGGGGRVHLAVNGPSSIIGRTVNIGAGTTGDATGSNPLGTCKAVGMTVPGCNP